jgi:peptide/nickel transport system ATP-binding protein
MSLDIQNLCVRIGSQEIVRDINLSVGDGESVGLVGLSGTGKSLITKSIFGFHDADSSVSVSGSALLDGEELLGMSATALAGVRGRSVGFIFQDPMSSLSPVKTIAAQIELPLKNHYRLTKSQRRERVLTMLARVGLSEDYASAYPGELSGGQAQRAAIALALITSPKLVIADEPTTALDVMTQSEIVDLLGGLVKQSGTSLLFITHDFSVLSRVTERVYVIGDALAENTAEGVASAGSVAGNGSVARIGGIGKIDNCSTVVESGETAEVLAAPHCAQTRELVRAAKELTFHVE